ncbi:ArsR/SmtB family transcription factor [Corynebacterium alimapuense]|uniref:Transcriptional regulator n=1 Tax=Corynebacterium alimapuense TaxID=1576874 RepID=A0A3M8K8T1_9CORY|nr:metalloregulator ArsR/SmtB family transcription factor [Corynebacterium alimapuense]RNE49580.1 transcriptional regulator [Corynebacterium alimapuense]
MATLSDTDLTAAEMILSALDSPLRVQIIQRLSDRDHFVHELVRGLGKSQPLVSQHLRVLKQSGIVDSERHGREVIYRLALPQTTDIIGAAATIGRYTRDEGQLAPVITLPNAFRTPDTEGLGQYAHAPAAVVAENAPADALPDPAPQPPTP